MIEEGHALGDLRTITAIQLSVRVLIRVTHARGAHSPRARAHTRTLHRFFALARPRARRRARLSTACSAAGTAVRRVRNLRQGQQFRRLLRPTDSLPDVAVMLAALRVRGLSPTATAARRLPSSLVASPLLQQSQRSSVTASGAATVTVAPDDFVEIIQKENLARDRWFIGLHAPRPLEAARRSPGEASGTASSSQLAPAATSSSDDREARLRKLDIYGTLAEKHVCLTRCVSPSQHCTTRYWTQAQ